MCGADSAAASQFCFVFSTRLRRLSALLYLRSVCSGQDRARCTDPTLGPAPKPNRTTATSPATPTPTPTGRCYHTLHCSSRWLKTNMNEETELQNSAPVM